MAIVISLLLIVLLGLWIIQALVGTKTKYTIVQEGAANPYDPAPGVRSAEEIKAISDAMPSEWCAYQGMTPPLRLKIRGQSLENYTRITRQYLDDVGRDIFINLPAQQQAAVNLRIIVDAYVTDWEGALYPNGNPLPFSLDNVMALLGKDEFLLPFIQDNAHRLSPPWPAQPPLP